jgi:preprotein translocase subunit SecY
VVETLKNLFAVPDLRNRVLFTLGMLAVYRLGNWVPTPGVNTEALRILTE